MSIFPDLDYEGGLAVFLHDRLIGRIYFSRFDNKPFFSSVPDGVSPVEFEKLSYVPYPDNSAIKHNEHLVLVDNLTGTRVPNDRYEIASFYMLAHFQTIPVIVYQKLPNPFKGETTVGGIKTAVILSPQFILKLPYRIVRAMIYCFRLTHYTRWAKKQLFKKVETHLASQKTAVIDLRRGYYWKHREDGTCQYFSFTETSLKTAPFVPLKKEFLTHIESFILALPAQNQSEFYLHLRSWIDPEKVVELVIFDPINLDGFSEYKNIKKLSLPHADDLESFDGLASFEQLEQIFISSHKDKSELFDAVKISDKIIVDCIFGHFTTNESCKKWQNGSWNDCSTVANKSVDEG